MTLHRFFVDPSAMQGERFAVPASIERQVRSVLRLGDGDRIVLLPGDGSEALCRIADGGCVVEERRRVESEPAHRLMLVQALLKGDALETVVQLGTEIGIGSFQLAVTERCIAREISPRKLERLRTIARESAEQSERGIIPEVVAPVSLAQALAPDAVLLYERDDAMRLGAVEPPETVIVGPEGGFTAAELDAAREAGVRIAGLGSRILRSQTAGAAAAAVILSRSGDFA